MAEKKTTGDIFACMGQIMRSVEAIKKEKVNKQGEGFKYRGIDDVMNSLHNAFAEAGVFIMPEVLERTEKERTSKNGNALFYITQKVKFTFFAPDGSSVSTIINGTAMDSGDKADNKSLSIALKYALLQAFLIPTEDLIDPDSQTHEVRPQNNGTPSPRPAGPPTLTEAAWMKAVERMNAGEKGIPEKLRKAYTLTDEQKHTLTLFEEVPA